MLNRDLILKILKKNFQKIKNKISKKLDWKTFEEVINFCIKDFTFFSSLNKKFYQKEGCPMGSSLSPILADIVLSELLDYVVKEMKKKTGYTPKFIAKYVDDLLVIIKSNLVYVFLRLLNSYNPLLNFTVELPIQGKIPYLDRQIIGGYFPVEAPFLVWSLSQYFLPY